jgi:DNA topoisomerase-3
MSKTLIIAEKPSVATDLARVLGKVPELGKFQRKKDYFENDNAFISSAVGHLVELKMPEGPNGKKLPWGMKHLPVIPKHFELQPIERSVTKYKLLVRLLKKKEVTSVVNACDAGREGELIFRYLLDMANLNKDLDVRRMWFQSMTDDAIMESWNNMRSNNEMQPLANAAICRSESDWLVGLNGTRALTAYNSRNGGFNVTTAGRVQTPTLVILAEREKIIREFVPEPYCEVSADFEVTAGTYNGRWFDENFKKDPENNQLKPERIWKKEDAEAIVSRCEGQIGSVEEIKKPQKQAPPLLFDLTSLQREAHYSARRTLQLAQACYDRYKVLTYPRTDSKYLPEDYIDTVKRTIRTFAKADANDAFSADYIKAAKWINDNKRVTPTKRVFNTAKVSDHFAIIPTGKIPPPKMDEDARKIYNIVMRRFLAIFYPSAEYENTRRITRIAQDSFLTTGKVLVVPGYLEVYGRKPGVAGDKDELCAAQDNEDAKLLELELAENETRPPARYNDGTLLSAMETAGKRVDDEELRDAMSERGLGTPATRASIIENLIRQKYCERDPERYRDIRVTNKGLALVELLQKIGIPELGSPEMTGEWEYKLKQMELGKLDRDTFMNEIIEMTKSIVNQTKEFTEEVLNRKYPDLKAPCPECKGQILKQTDGIYECYNPECTFRMKKYIASHELTPDQAAELIATRRIGPFDTFKSRFGNDFSAELTLAKEKKTWKLGFVFEGDDLREEELKNLSDEQVFCECKVADDSDKMVKVYQTEKAYLCPDMATKADERGVRISKTILKKEIPLEQAILLFVEGKTELMPGFFSNKKKRNFAAHLTLDRKSGKLGFEFAPKKKKAAEEGEEGDGKKTKKKAKKKASKKKAKKKSKKKTTKKKAAKKKAPTVEKDEPKNTEANSSDS